MNITFGTVRFSLGAARGPEELGVDAGLDE